MHFIMILSILLLKYTGRQCFRINKYLFIQYSASSDKIVIGYAIGNTGP